MIDVIVKSAWPELVGMKVDGAAVIIMRENPTVIRVNPVVHGKMVPTTDFYCDRVWAWVNDSNVIIKVPIIG